MPSPRGLALSAALHLSLVSGLAAERGSITPAFAERPGLDDYMLSLVPREPLAALGRATVRCHSNGRGHVSNCRWLSESGAGWGDEAVAQLNTRGKFYGPEGRVRGPVTFEIEVCAGLCPIYD